jgi:hypothetical protein
VTHLRVVAETGEVVDDPRSREDLLVENQKLKDHIGSALMKVGKLEAGERRTEERKSSAAQIREVLFDWRSLCMKRPDMVKVVANSPRWRKVADRLKDRDEETGEPAFSVADLKYAIRGALLSRFHRDNGYLDAVTIFRDPGTVEKHLKRYWDWAFTEEGEYHFFWRQQQWLREKHGDWGIRFADVLLNQQYDDECERQWEWWCRGRIPSYTVTAVWLEGIVDRLEQGAQEAA